MNRQPAYNHRNTLSVSEDEAFIFVKGDTFRYGFDKRSGLISHLEVLGDDFLRATESQIPDIYVSDARDPRVTSYAAKYEGEAECDVISANPYEVHIRTHGVYHNPSGETFPVRYRITYEIQSDGTIFVIVHNKAYDPCVIRWLCISRGILDSSLCKYFSHLADQSKVDTTADYVFKDIPEIQDQTLFSGRLIPWFWLGNDRTGVEMCIWDVTHHRYGATQIAGEMVDPLGEVGANVSVSTSSNGVLWEIYSLRNLQTPVKDGWEQINYFTLSVTPPRQLSPEFADLRAYWAGPRRYDASHKYLSGDEIDNLSRMGCNLLIGGVNWRSGEFIPDNEAEAKRVISTCHEHGIKIVPFVPLMDLNEDTSIFGEHGPEWRIEPVVEYEYKTHLMCPGAEEWREHWRQQIDRITEDYGFDGVYLDLWYDKLTCRNPQHGCQRRYMRPTFPWVRDMVRYARAKFKTTNPDSVIIANTDILPISMICSWVDVRSVGALQDVRRVDRTTGKAFYSSHRLGSNSLMWSDPEQKIDLHLISLSLLYMAPILLSRERNQEEQDLILQYWNVLRASGVGEAKWYPGFVDADEAKVITTSNPDLCVNAHKGDSLLLTLVNLSPDEVRADVFINSLSELGLEDGKVYLVYEPISRSLLGGRERWACNDLRAITVNVPGYSPRLLCIRECAENPVLLSALGSDRVTEELWDESAGTLRSQLEAPIGADVSLAIYCPAGKPARIVSAGEETQFTWDETQKLAFFGIQTSDATTDVEVETS